MKKYIYSVTLFLGFLTCNAQQVEDQLDNSFKGAKDVYYKDFDNELDLFEGVYSCTNDSISFDLALKKIKKSYVNGWNYEDIIVGDLRFVKNGVEVINSLADFNADYFGALNGDRYHAIKNGAVFIDKRTCPTCVPNEKYLIISYHDARTNHWATFVITKNIVNGVAGIKVNIGYNEVMRIAEARADKDEPRISFGNYFLTKMYFNNPIWKQVSRNNCPPGATTPYQVRYEVHFGKYRSTISQLHADNQALDDINANAQNYANTRGECKF